MDLLTYHDLDILIHSIHTYRSITSTIYNPNVKILVQTKHPSFIYVQNFCTSSAVSLFLVDFELICADIGFVIIAVSSHPHHTHHSQQTLFRNL